MTLGVPAGVLFPFSFVWRTCNIGVAVLCRGHGEGFALEMDGWNGLGGN